MIATMLLAMALTGAPGAKDRAPEPDACIELSAVVYATVTPKIARQGAALTLRPVWTHGYDGEHDADWNCFSKWRTSAPKIARVDVKKHVLSIAPSAERGTEIVVYATYRGEERAVARLRVVGATEAVLIGTWHEKARSEGCAGRRLAELRLYDSGGFDYTFPEQMFETMVSGGGKYRWDAASGVLMLDDRRYLASLVDGNLVLEGAEIDLVPPLPPGAPPRPVCRMTLSGG